MTQWGLDTLFNPAKRHMDDEKRRLQATREEAGDSSGGKRIDLASGKVRIQKSESDTDAGSESDARPGGNPGAKPESKPSSAAKREPSAAAVRAAKRRGRTL